MVADGPLKYPPVNKQKQSEESLFAEEAWIDIDESREDTTIMPQTKKSKLMQDWDKIQTRTTVVLPSNTLTKVIEIKKKVKAVPVPTNLNLTDSTMGFYSSVDNASPKVNDPLARFHKVYKGQICHIDKGKYFVRFGERKILEYQGCIQDFPQHLVDVVHVHYAVFVKVMQIYVNNANSKIEYNLSIRYCDQVSLSNVGCIILKKLLQKLGY